METTPTGIETIASTYFDSWRSKDFARLRTLLADDVVFDGPMGHVDTAEDCRQAMERGLGPITDDIVVKHVFVDGDDVLTWFELHTNVAADPLEVANWTHVEDGRITRIKVTFDPRPLLPPAGS